MKSWLWALVIPLLFVVGVAGPDFRTSVATDLACTGCVGPVDLATDSVESTELANQICTSVIQSTVTATVAGGTDDFLNLLDGAGGTTENDEDDFLSGNSAIVMSALHCIASAAPGVGQDSWLMTVRTGTPGSLGDTALTCTIDEAATTCDGVGGAVAIAAKKAVTISIDSENGGGADPDAANITCIICTGS
jgi:hypothetical protein